ncbi:hypothetical protein GGTG_01614 [Gaeumannomyces tritici R3-111a-1]|uniref:Major facilitator superfamily (MFS) profile domain-containing protein n=1 Tax=Gaeumannomyces tritici (strain R3-111a-1) TaxID=644352 RepID=J3NK32_GAET3|nr:hypothetical protein GGTG_01614 [Gaeumannomyces tritici R3-111a-1]EJT81636.1 hypothetical protein GGTG_01614 [Gaeumannomyces tritici R3-111a-1]
MIDQTTVPEKAIPEKSAIGAADGTGSSTRESSISPVPAHDEGAAPAGAAKEGRSHRESDVDSIPDGGMVAWLQVLGSWVILVDTWGLVNSFGVFQTHYKSTMLPSTSSSSISWIGSLQASLMMLVGVVSGPLYDMGYFRVLIGTGLFLIILGQFLLSVCTTYWQVLLAQGIMTGIGMGLTFLPSTTILAQYFHRKRALVLGISSTGSPIAGTVIPILFSRLEPRIGFGWTVRTLAFILLAVSVIPLACMRTRVAPAPRRRRFFDPTAVRDAAFMTHALAAFCAFAVMYVPYFYLQLFAQTHGLAGPDLSPYVVTMLNAGSIVGRVLPNYLADRVGSVNVVAACGVAASALVLGWFGVRDLAGLAAFAVLYGLFSGGIVSVTPSVLMALTPDPGRVGARIGMAFSCTGVAILIGTPIAGAVVGDFSDARWRAVVGFSSGGLLAATALYLICRFLLYRSNGKWKA